MIALCGGMILITDVRLMGVAMKKWPAADMIEQLRWPKRIGLVVIVTCGFLLFASKAEEYYYNWFFWAKISLLSLVLLHQIAFRRSVYRNPNLNRAPIAGALSMILW